MTNINAETGEVLGPTITRPLVTTEQAINAYNEYQQLKQAVAGPEDFIAFRQQGRELEAPTKKWRVKLCKFYGVSCEIVSEEIEHMPDGSYVFKATAKATAPNGQFMYGDGSCWSETKKTAFGKNSDVVHNTRSHAVTRAKNRAVLELVGFGEVSAEEISGDGNSEIPKPTNAQAPRETPKPRPVSQTAAPQGAGMTGPQRQFLMRLLGHFAKDDEGKIDALKARYGADINTLDKTGASAIIERVKNDIAAMKRAEQAG